MNENLVFFGPTHSGKSTLIGHLYSHNLSIGEYNRNVMRFKRNLGENFDISSIDRYFLDKGKDEAVPEGEGVNPNKENHSGTSKRKHLIEIDLDENLTVPAVDTPGSDLRWRNSFQGIYMGDVGIFVIEITWLQKIMDMLVGSQEYTNELDRLLAPIYLWNNYGRQDQLLIVISKSDLCGHSKYIITRAKQILHSIEILRNVPIVVISIDVKRRTDTNIFTGMDDEEVFGESLISAIKTILQNNERKLAERIELFYKDYSIASIDRLFKHIKSTKEPAIRVKILEGYLKTGDTVILGPVINNGNPIEVTGVIKSLMYDACRRQVSVLEKNNIGGITFSKLTAGRKTIELKDITIPNSALLFKNKPSTVSGNFLKLQAPVSEISKLKKKISLNDEIRLIWYGKVVFLRLLSLCRVKDKYQFCMMNAHNDFPEFCFKIGDDGSIINSEYVLQYKESYICAKVIQVHTVTSIEKKDIVITLRGNYTFYTYTGDFESESLYVPGKTNLTILSLKGCSGKSLLRVLFKGNIKSDDIISIAVKK